MRGDFILINTNMKKILIPIACVIATSFMIACGIVPDNSSTNDSDSLVLDSIALGDMEFKTETKEFTDSLEQNDVNISYTLNLDVPVSGNPVLVDSIKTWMHHLLGKSYEGEVNFDDEMLNHYAQEYFQDCDEEGMFDGFGAYLELNVTMATDSADFVSYQVSGYDYTGGAHGMPFFYGVTFDKEDGSRLGWDIFADTTQLAPIVKQHIASYFDETDPESALEECLFDGVYDDFPLPYSDPWLEADGVRFVYSAYEIAPFVAGMPECTIPYKKVEKYLSDKAKKLLQK